ncbi:hypothetical protein GCM10010499_34700 [Streptomyces thermoviolaceus subsp. apingens]|nr:hypothetical protein GCM10010499_34700 [Streptomyces thermoviolaceus subsp. apingens]
MKATGCKRDWYKGRLPVWIRGLVVLVIGWAVFLCGQQVADGYRATMAYRDAPVCDVGDRGGNGNDSVACVRLETGMVLDRWTSWECTSNGTSHDGGRTCTTYHEIKIEWPDGADWLRVPSHMYDQAKKGDRAEVRLWRGEVVGVEVRGRDHSYPPSSQTSVLVGIALSFLGLLVGVWGAVSGRLSDLFAFPNWGWPMVAFGVGGIGSLALFGGHPVAWGIAILWTGFMVYWVVGAWEVTGRSGRLARRTSSLLRLPRRRRRRRTC